MGRSIFLLGFCAMFQIWWNGLFQRKDLWKLKGENPVHQKITSKGLEIKITIEIKIFTK